MRGLALAILLAAALPVPAQLFQRLFNPEVDVTLTHPPGLGLRVRRVAFGPVSDPRAEELVSSCIAELSRSEQLEVIDRGNLERVLAEQKFSNSGLVDSAQAVALGKLLGSPVLLLVKVHAAKVTQTPLVSRVPYTDRDGDAKTITTYVSKTAMDYSASIQAVDCATGRIYSVQRVVANPSQENSSTQGQPEFPPEGEVRERALGQAVTQVSRLLLPWTENRRLIFYDDKDYGMKEAYRLLVARDYEGAEAKSREAVAKAKADPKVKSKYLARTDYNLGICKFIQGQYGAAQPYLKAAFDLDTGNGIFREAHGECQRAIRLMNEMAKVEARSGPGAPQAAAPTPAQAGGPDPLEERLERLERLRRKGLISQGEYEQQRRELMKQI